MRKPRIVLTQPLCHDAMRLLMQSAELTVAGSSEASVLTPLLADAEALIFRYGKITTEIFDAAPHLRVVAKPGVGYDGINLAAAAQRGIKVALCPPLNARAVAEHTLTLLLTCAKNLQESVQQTRAGNYEIRSAYRADNIEGKTVVVCGFGHIGREVARLCSALGMQVLVYGRHKPADFSESGYVWSECLPQAVAVGDYVTLHLPATEQTTGLFNEGLLAHMKPGAFLINTARGELVDHYALLRAVQQGQLAGAGLDFLDEEPIHAEHPLLHDSRIVVTPHMAAMSAQTAQRMALCIAEATLTLLRGGSWQYLAGVQETETR